MTEGLLSQCATADIGLAGHDTAATEEGHVVGEGSICGLRLDI